MEETNPSSEIRSSLVRYAALILGARPYFSGRLREKLRLRAEKLQFEKAEPIIEKIITDLTKDRLLDDQYLAAAYVRKELKKGWGPKVILLKLMRLGVGRETAQEVLLIEADLSHQKDSIASYLKKISHYNQHVQINKLFQRGFNSAAILPLFDYRGD